MRFRVSYPAGYRFQVARPMQHEVELIFEPLGCPVEASGTESDQLAFELRTLADRIWAQVPSGRPKLLASELHAIAAELARLNRE